MTDAALFDWDGTLLDSREALLGAWHAATDEVVGRRFPVTAEEEELVFTLPGAHLFPRVAGDDDGARRLAAAFQRAYESTSERVRAFPGVVEMLRDLRGAGVRIAVVTSKARRRFAADAERIGVAELVDVAICQEDTSQFKPSPEPVLHALRGLGVEADRAVMVGDTPVDVEAGAAAGTRVVGVAWGASGAGPLLDAGADAVADDAADLERLVLQSAGERERTAT